MVRYQLKEKHIGACLRLGKELTSFLSNQVCVSTRQYSIIESELPSRISLEFEK